MIKVTGGTDGSVVERSCMGKDSVADVMAACRSSISNTEA